MPFSFQKITRILYPLFNYTAKSSRGKARDVREARPAFSQVAAKRKEAQRSIWTFYNAIPKTP